jgi:hypothetical protein
MLTVEDLARSSISFEVSNPLDARFVLFGKVPFVMTASFLFRKALQD